MQYDAFKNKNIWCARGDIKTILFSITISISVSVYSAQSTIESLQLSKLHFLLETVYWIKKEIPSHERYHTERRSTQGERNSINPQFRFLPRYNVIFRADIGKAIVFLVFIKIKRTVLVLFTLFRNIPIFIFG